MSKLPASTKYLPFNFGSANYAKFHLFFWPSFFTSSTCRKTSWPVTGSLPPVTWNVRPPRFRVTPAQRTGNSGRQISGSGASFISVSLSSFPSSIEDSIDILVLNALLCRSQARAIRVMLSVLRAQWLVATRTSLQLIREHDPFPLRAFRSAHSPQAPVARIPGSDRRVRRSRNRKTPRLGKNTSTAEALARALPRSIWRPSKTGRSTSPRPQTGAPLVSGPASSPQTSRLPPNAPREYTLAGCLALLQKLQSVC